jgi:hypothetical protein
MAYTVSVVLIQSEAAARSAPPVLQRGAGDTGPQAQAVPPAVLQAVRNPLSPLLPALRLGDDVQLAGQALARDGTLDALFTCDRLALANPLPTQLGRSAGERLAHLPTPGDDPAAMAAWGAGVYMVSLRVVENGRPTWTTNGVPIALAPAIMATPLAAPANAAFTLSVTCTPRIAALQEAGVRLLFGDVELTAASLSTPPDPAQPTTLSFDVPARPAGRYLLRLRVDGIDSLPITAAGAPPVFSFDPAQQVTLS